MFQIGQDGSIGRYTLPPHTTKRRPTTNLKTKNNQNCQKIKLYESLTTKELRKKHSSRLVGGTEVDNWVERTHGKAMAGGPGWAQWQLVVPHLHADKLGGTTRGARQTTQPRAPVQGNKASDL